MPASKRNISPTKPARRGRPAKTNPVRVTPAMARAAAKAMDWSKFDAMTDADIAKQVASNPDAAPLPVNVADIRKRTGLDQAAFARLFAIPLGTLRNWEQWRRTPEGPARALLRIIDHDPVLAMKALRGAPLT